MRPDVLPGGTMDRKTKMPLPRRRLPFALLVLALAIPAYFLFRPVPIDPVVWQPAANPGMSGPYAPNDRLRGMRLLPDAGPGPESVAIDRDGRFYTGLQDGRVVRVLANGSAVETFVQTGGRPLGMKFDSAGNLIVADAFRGLLCVSPERKITVLADSVNGERMLFPNDIAIAADGAVWFSDASRRFDQRHWMLDFLEGRPTGRLLCYDPRTNRVRVVLDRLMFANGVAIGPGDEYVLVNETLAARIVRYWLRGPKARQSDIFASALPGYPDNLTYNGRGVFWVALPSPRNLRTGGFRQNALVAQSAAKAAGAVAQTEGRTHGLGARVQHGGPGGAQPAGSRGRLRTGHQRDRSQWPAVFWQYRYDRHRMDAGAVGDKCLTRTCRIRGAWNRGSSSSRENAPGCGNLGVG